MVPVFHQTNGAIPLPNGVQNGLVHILGVGNSLFNDILRFPEQGVMQAVSDKGRRILFQHHGYPAQILHQCHFPVHRLLRGGIAPDDLHQGHQVRRIPGVGHQEPFRMTQTGADLPGRNGGRCGAEDRLRRADLLQMCHDLPFGLNGLRHRLNAVGATRQIRIRRGRRKVRQSGFFLRLLHGTGRDQIIQRLTHSPESPLTALLGTAIHHRRIPIADQKGSRPGRHDTGTHNTYLTFCHNTSSSTWG